MGLTSFPEVVVHEEGSEEDAAHELAQRLKILGVSAPLVVATTHGKRLGAAIENPVEYVQPIAGADQRWALDLGGLARRRGADAVVAIGGGRCLDVAKLAAARAGVAVVAVPTQPSHDGICSPVAVVPAGSGCGQSVGAVAPRLVFISVPTLLSAPLKSVAAGLGDLLANPLALRDWALASERGLATVDKRAWELSTESFERISPHFDSDIERTGRDPARLRELADALVISGLAMIRAGNSRPASGGEHEISHAIDERFPGRALHGAQVAFGCIISTTLYGDDASALRARLRRVGLPDHPSQLGLSQNDVVEVLLCAPQTRPGRFTILEESDLDAARALALVTKIWTD
ncbi:iron-containing alcohol dehydrogenase family protein [soil metagenome]